MNSEPENISIPLAQVISVEENPHTIIQAISISSDDEEDSYPNCNKDLLCLCACCCIIVCVASIVGVPTLYSYFS